MVDEHVMLEPRKAYETEVSSQRRNAIERSQLIGSKWTALTALEHDRHMIVTGWAMDTPTDCDGAPDSVIIESVSTGRSRVIMWRALRNAQNWMRGWA